MHWTRITPHATDVAYRLGNEALYVGEGLQIASVIFRIHPDFDPSEITVTAPPFEVHCMHAGVTVWRLGNRSLGLLEGDMCSLGLLEGDMYALLEGYK